MADITKAITAAREALAAYRRNSTRHYIDEALEDVLAALDAAQGEAVVEFMGRRRTPEKTSECWGVLLCDFMQDPPKGTKLYAAPQAPPAQPLVERYGDGVLVHWPEGVEQYVQVGDCVTGYLARPTQPVAVPAGFAEWLAREMPAGTTIGDPQWWAKLIARRFAQFAANKENNNG